MWFSAVMFVGAGAGGGLFPPPLLPPPPVFPVPGLGEGAGVWDPPDPFIPKQPEMSNAELAAKKRQSVRARINRFNTEQLPFSALEAAALSGVAD